MPSAKSSTWDFVERLKTRRRCSDLLAVAVHVALYPGIIVLRDPNRIADGNDDIVMILVKCANPLNSRSVVRVTNVDT